MNMLTFLFSILTILVFSFLILNTIDYILYLKYPQFENNKIILFLEKIPFGNEIILMLKNLLLPLIFIGFYVNAIKEISHTPSHTPSIFLNTSLLLIINAVYLMILFNNLSIIRQYAV